ncbi:hypothetical protein B0T26DRAFT_873081 [Lasiosphaeria miniovina]|uniref:Uncharacterized protein n=1 Tax=Lasiosphaeria miniovina TaxID=1954250 RepID=A0AA40ABD1_9PEZI|nr:uncharacterized protein B0T26DRAFT_873081 [Lasiosphaeria miniovina]KAK0712748.1 hypothetical protein B0T26DRAFT_873081 [Lasiosphaeria miniovina]
MDEHHRNASVICFVAQLALEDPLARYPQKLLSDFLDDFSRRQQQQQQNQAAKPDGHRPGLLMGFEIEFVLVDSSFDIATLSALEHTNAYSMATGLSILEEIVWERVGRLALAIVLQEGQKNLREFGITGVWLANLDREENHDSDDILVSRNKDFVNNPVPVNLGTAPAVTASAMAAG